MSRLQQITRVGYQVKVQWECEFNHADIETLELFATQQCVRDLCVPGTLCTRAGLRPCV